MSDDFLPTKQVKKWNTDNKRLKKDESWQNKTNPFFCPCIDPDTGKKCGRLLEQWGEFFYREYGMCENCFSKYNCHIEDLKEKIKQIKDSKNSEEQH